MDTAFKVCDNGRRMHLLKRIGIVLSAVAIIAVVFWAGFYVGRTQLLRVEDNIIIATGLFTPADINFSLFWDVWEELDSRFVGSSDENIPSEDERVFGAIKGLTSSFGDPYTVFLPPAESTLFEEDIRGNFGGVGMEIGVENEILTVIAPLRGTPADLTGVRAGDTIVAIDETSTFGMSVDEAVLRIRGEVGTPVTLTIVRSDVEEVLEVTIIRDVIIIPTLETVFRDDGIFVIHLFNFGVASPDEFRVALRDYVRSGSTKLILDLRGNPGGFLQASIDVSSWFLPVGQVVVSEDSGSESKVHRSKGYNIFDDTLDMVVLIDGGSASASEIVAGALRDHGVATLIGTQTFGKGSVQELVDIGFNSLLRLTVAHWLTPSGESISEDGITPDIVVEVDVEDLVQGKDSQLETAVAFLLRL